MERKRASVWDTRVMVSEGKTKAPLGPSAEELRASKSEMAARSLYTDFSSLARGGERSDMEKRMPLLLVGER